jgi:hypothetical protein
VTERKRRKAAVANVEETCPRCGAPRGPRQEYCIECGLRLAPMFGAIAGLRRRWIERFGWYPGDWVWPSLLGLLVAVAGAAVAIALSDPESKGGTTIIASPPSSQTSTGQTTAATTTKPLPVPPEPTTSTSTKTTTPVKTTPTTTTTTTATTTTAPTANGETIWPAATNGWTIVLLSYPVSGGRAAPLATAKRATRSGLTQVGLLNSGDWSSLHPGYYVVFTGIYTSNAAAQAAVSHARAGGFPSAYVREIVR